jgi:hypothetical protein
MSLILNSGFTIGPGVILDSYSPPPPLTLVATNLLFDLDMQNYMPPLLTWPDVSSNHNNFVFTNTPVVVNTGTNTAYWDNIAYYVWADPIAGVTLPGGGAILPAGSYTKGVMLWHDGNAGTGNILSSGTANDVFWTAQTSPPVLNAGHNGSWSTVAGNIPIPAYSWTYVAVTFDTTTGWTLYQNGDIIGTNASTTVFGGGSSAPEIGAFAGAGYGFVGKFAAAHEYTRALTQSEIQQNYRHYLARYNGATPT